MRRRTIKTILITFISVIVLIMVLIPVITKKTIINNSKKWFGRQISLESLKVNYFTGTVKILDFKMYEANDSDIFVSFDTLIFDTEPYQLFSNEFVVEEIYLEGLYTNLILYDSTFNFDDLIEFHISNENNSNRDTTTGDPIHFQISNIEISRANILFEDKKIDKIVQIKGLSFSIPYIGWNQEDASEAGVHFLFDKGGYFDSFLHLDPNSGDFDARVIINKLYFAPFDKYAFEYANITSVNGILNTEINLEGNIFKPEAIIASGNIDVLDFEITDNNNKKILATDKFHCIISKADPANSSIIIDTLALIKPYIYFELSDSTNNISEILNINPKSSDSVDIAKGHEVPQNTDTTRTLFYKVNSFIIQDGIVDYSDNLTDETFNYHLSNIEINSDSISSTSKWIDIYSKMLLNNRGTLYADLGFNPANPMDMNLDFTIKDFLLPDLNIYTNYYMGHAIVNGDMYYHSKTEINNGLIHSENSLIIQNATLDNTEKGLYSLPLKFAFFLLKDKDGVINLDVPVRGDLNDPKLSFGKIIWNTFKNLIVKAAASPGKLLAGLVNGDPKQLEAIEFNYLDTALMSGQQKQLDLLLELEQKKRDLKIELVYFNDIDKQKEAIAENEAGKLYYKKTKRDYIIDKEGFEAFLLENANSDSLDYQNVCLLLATPQLVDSLTILYNETRFLNISGYLNSVNDSTHIIAKYSDPEAPENVGISLGFKIEYSMIDEIVDE